MSVPVLSRSLIGDRTATDGDAAKRPRPAAKQWPSTEAREQDRVRPERLAQACRWAQPLPAQSPTTPTLRANPYPEVTDPICRLPLPTLFYRPEAVHLGDLLRIWVRAGASPPSPPRDFQGPAVCSWMPRELRHFAKNQNPFSVRDDSRASAAYAEKTTLPRATAGVSRSRRVATTDTRVRIGSATRFRNMDRIPFRRHRGSLKKESRDTTRLIKASPKP